MDITVRSSELVGILSVRHRQNLTIQNNLHSEAEILASDSFQLGKDIEKFYELNQQLSMDDLARSISFTMKSGQWTMQKIPFSGEGQHTQGSVW